MRLINDMGLECTASSSGISDHIERIGALLRAARSDLRGHLALQPLLPEDQSVYSTMVIAYESVASDGQAGRG